MPTTSEPCAAESCSLSPCDPAMIKRGRGCLVCIARTARGRDPEALRTQAEVEAFVTDREHLRDTIEEHDEDGDTHSHLMFVLAEAGGLADDDALSDYIAAERIVIAAANPKPESPGARHDRLDEEAAAKGDYFRKRRQEEGY